MASSFSQKPFIWLTVAMAVGFITPAVFAGWLHWPRTWFLVPYAVATFALLASYVYWSALDLKELLRNQRLLSVALAVIVGGFMAFNVLSQPASLRPQGGQLLFAIIWLGVVYGTLDALLLSVLPVVIVQRAFSKVGRKLKWSERLAVNGFALAASILETAVYHVGFTEFRSADLVAPIIGNGIITLAFMLTMNPSTAIASHVVMHITAIWHGMETAMQLPPHY